jgi:hypothetical protein
MVELQLRLLKHQCLGCDVASDGIAGTIRNIRIAWLLH